MFYAQPTAYISVHSQSSIAVVVTAPCSFTHHLYALTFRTFADFGFIMNCFHFIIDVPSNYTEKLRISI